MPIQDQIDISIDRKSIRVEKKSSLTRDSSVCLVTSNKGYFVGPNFQDLKKDLEIAIGKLGRLRFLVPPNVTVFLPDSQLQHSILSFDVLPRSQRNIGTLIKRRLANETRANEENFSVAFQVISENAPFDVWCTTVSVAIPDLLESVLAQFNLSPDAIISRGIYYYNNYRSQLKDCPGAFLGLHSDDVTLSVWNSAGSLCFFCCYPFSSEDGENVDYQFQEDICRYLRTYEIKNKSSLSTYFYASNSAPERIYDKIKYAVTKKTESQKNFEELRI